MIDLTPAREAVEALMVDECDIYSADSYGYRVRTFDRATGEWVDPDPAVTPASSGACMFRDGDPATEDGRPIPVATTDATVSVSLDRTPVAEPGDIIVITACTRDDEVVGRVYRVVSSSGGTMKVSRRYYVERVVATDPSAFTPDGTGAP